MRASSPKFVMTSTQPWRAEARALILLALPMIAGNIAWSAIAASDLLLLGRRGAESVAAGSPSTCSMPC